MLSVQFRIWFETYTHRHTYTLWLVAVCIAYVCSVHIIIKFVDFHFALFGIHSCLTSWIGYRNRSIPSQTIADAICASYFSVSLPLPHDLFGVFSFSFVCLKWWSNGNERKSIQFSLQNFFTIYRNVEAYTQKTISIESQPKRAIYTHRIVLYMQL